MQKTPSSEALDSVRNIWNASIVIILTWCFFLPSAVERLNAYDTALHMTAWRLLVELSRALPTSVSSDRYLKVGYAVNRPASGFVGQRPPKYRYPLLGLDCWRLKADSAIDQPGGEDCSPLVLNATWPEQRRIVVFLSTEFVEAKDGFDGSAWQPNPGASLVHFKVVAHAGKLPISSYIVSYVGPTEYYMHNQNDSWTKVVMSSRTVPYSRPLKWRVSLPCPPPTSTSLRIDRKS